MHTEERGVQTYFPKVVKSFRTVTIQTDNNIAINILNNKKEHPEDMNILDHNQEFLSEVKRCLGTGSGYDDGAALWMRLKH